MAHPPQEILIKVPCSDRLPSDKAYYHTNRGRLLFDILWYSAFGIVRDITYWYEPATRVVLTVEECEEIQKKINLLAADNRRLMAKHTNPYKY